MSDSVISETPCLENGLKEDQDRRTEDKEDQNGHEVPAEVPTPSTKLDPDKLLVEKLQKLNMSNIELAGEKDELQNRVKELERIHSELSTKIERFQQQIDAAKKELQGMVMKYAKSEQEVLNLKKHLADSDRKLKESIKERDNLQARLKDLTAEKKQLIGSVERHVLETASLKTEVELSKNRLDQCHVREEKLQLQLETLTRDNEALKTKVDGIEAGIAKLPKLSPRSQQTRYSLGDDDDFDDDILPEIENSLTVPESKSRSRSPSKSPINQETQESQEPTDYTALFQQVLETNQRFEKEKDYLHAQNSELEGKIEELQNRLAESVARCDDYDRKIIIIEEFKQELIRKQGVVDSLKDKFDQICTINRSLVGDIDCSKSKESELLDYTERLTAKLVSLQSGSNQLESSLKEFQERFGKLQQEHDTLLVAKTELEAEFGRFRQEADTEGQRSKEELETATETNVILRKRVEELENDIAIGKKKHLSALKEMSGELQRLRKSHNNHQSNSCPATDQATSSSLSSRTGSISSLNNETPAPPTPKDPPRVIPPIESSRIQQNPESQETPSDSLSETTTCDTNQEIITSLSQIKKSVLIEKLLKLQRILVKRKEKIDFLEEHSEQLTTEVRNKTKLLQNYILKEETGALSTDSMDQNKAYLSKRGGGIMSSLYNSFSTDDSMTLERSLEINAKLHALLEDTLLKNMTLKENLNTLAGEIAKLQTK